MKINGIKTILFRNGTVGQTIFKNSFWLAAAEVVNKVLIFVLFIYIARILGATEYGKFNFAIAAMYLFNIFPALVAPEIITREFSQDKNKEKEYSALLSLKIVLGLGSTALLLVSSFFLSSDPILRKIIWVLALYNLCGVPIDAFYAFFRARQQMEYESLIKIADAILSSVLIAFVIFMFPSAQNLSYAYLAEGFVLISLVMFVFHLKVFRLSFTMDRAVWRKIISLSWPMALIGIVMAVFSQADSVIMGSLGQMTENGWYAAASRLTKIALIPTVLLFHSFFPVLSSFSREQIHLQKIWSYQMKIMIIFAIPILIGGVALAPQIIGLFYGESYLPSILVFQILMMAVGIVFLYDSFRQILIAKNRQKTLFGIILIGAAANLILNLILIPRFSLYGAAMANIISNLIILLLFVSIILKFNHLNLFDAKILFTFLIALFSGGAMYFAISLPWVDQFNAILLIVIGGAVYFMSFYLFKTIFKLNYSYEKA